MISRLIPTHYLLSLLRTYRTVRWLRGEQIRGQLVKRVRDRLPWRQATKATSIPEWSGVRWEPRCPFLPPARTETVSVDPQHGDFAFLNKRRHLGWPPQWDPEGVSLLWRFHLHYFEYVWGLDFDDAHQAAVHWISDQEPDRKLPSWSSYVISLRLQNWSAYFFSQHVSRFNGDPEIAAPLWESMYSQAEHLSRNLETHLLGNHLWENGVALAMVGACFEDEAAERWLRKGMCVLDREIEEQVLSDGGHFERSPMYHLRALYTLALLANTGNRLLLELVVEPLSRMAKTLADMLHPDRDIALFNDSVLKSHAEPIQLLKYVDRLLNDLLPNSGETESSAQEPPRQKTPEACGMFSGAGPIELAETGYFGWRTPGSREAHYVLCDAGPIGPDYIPGHAHGDMLSFELSLLGERVITDSGVFDYEISETRRASRSTAAHNTVEVGGYDQCEFWGAFRVGRRGRTGPVRFDRHKDGFSLAASHDGYQHLPGKPVHLRTIRWYEDGVLVVRDDVNCGQRQPCVTHLHLAPSCSLSKLTQHEAVVHFRQGQFSICFDSESAVELTESPYFSQMGVRIMRPCLRVTWLSSDGPTAFCVSLHAPDSFSIEQGAKICGRTYGW